MALQAALLPSTLSVPKKAGNLAAVVKDTAFLTVPQKVS
jgi:protochlorophyllide reductase